MIEYEKINPSTFLINHKFQVAWNRSDIKRIYSADEEIKEYYKDKKEILQKNLNYPGKMVFNPSDLYALEKLYIPKIQNPDFVNYFHINDNNFFFKTYFFQR